MAVATRANQKQVNGLCRKSDDDDVLFCEEAVFMLIFFIISEIIKEHEGVINLLEAFSKAPQTASKRGEMRCRSLYCHSMEG